MKQLKAFLLRFLMMFVLLMLPLMLWAADSLPTPPITFDLQVYFGSFLMYVATCVILLIPLFNRMFKLEGWPKRLMSWAVLLVVALIGYIAKWGIFDTDLLRVFLIWAGGIVGAFLGYEMVKQILYDYHILPAPEEKKED